MSDNFIYLCLESYFYRVIDKIEGRNKGLSSFYIRLILD